MNKLYKFIFNKRVKNRKIISSLEAFIQQIYWGDDLSPDESKKNIEEGLIELIKFGGHSSNGLLITDNGYFLTAKHCVDKSISELEVKLENGEICKIEGVCKVSEKEDLALAKLKISGKCEPKKYRIYNTNGFKKIPVALITRWDGGVIANYGILERNWNRGYCRTNGERKRYPNHMELTLKSKPGNSGGTIITPDGRFVGLLQGGDKINSSSIIKSMSALELVDSYKRELIAEI